MNKILHICSDYFGSELYKNLISELSDQGSENIIYVPKFHSGPNSSDSILIAPRKYSLFERILFKGKEKIGLQDICQRVRLSEISIIHSHNLFSGGYIAYLLYKQYNIPYIVTVRNTDLNIFFKYMFHLRKLGTRIMDSAHNIIFISPSYKKHTIENYVSKKFRNKIKAKSIVIPNGINNYFLLNRYSRSGFIWNNKTIKLICVSELNRNKNITTTIKACQELKKNYDVHLNLVGEIIDNKFKKLIKKYDFITYYPKCPKENVMKYLRGSEIFVMPSITETFGLAYTEAMSQGLPIIYSKGQGFDGFFNIGEVGYSVNPMNYMEIARTILKIYNNYNDISNNCIRGISIFDWKLISSCYINLYKNLKI